MTPDAHAPAHPTAARPRVTPATSTTKRGFATASFSLGLWGLITFWWYPFGMMVATVGVLFGVVTLLFGIRAGKDGENLAALGIFLGSSSIGLAITVYRFMQLAFEGFLPEPTWSSEYELALTCIAIVVSVVGLIGVTYQYSFKTKPMAVPPH